MNSPKFYNPAKVIKQDSGSYGLVKSLFFLSLYLIPSLSFILLIGDPTIFKTEATTGLSIYSPALIPLINFIYYLSSILETPVRVLSYLIIQEETYFFPYISSAYVLDNIKKFIERIGFLQFLLPHFEYGFAQRYLIGVFSWFPPLTLILIKLASGFIEQLYDWARKMTEKIKDRFSIIQKREEAYKKAMGKRQEALQKIHQDYRELSETARSLKNSVITDELTQVYNKRYFMEKIREEFDYSKNNKKLLSLIMVDIDHFKKLNDTYGHLTGDLVLKAVAAALSSETPPNAHCCRFGGEEFAIILPGKDHRETLSIANNLLNNLPQISFDDYPDITITSSFGVASIDFSSPDAASIESHENMIHIADTELYNSKLNGRNQISITRIPF